MEVKGAAGQNENTYVIVEPKRIEEWSVLAEVAIWPDDVAGFGT